MRVLARFAIATCKTPDAGRCVACKRRCVIMEPQALAQSYRPQRSVILDRVPFGHLRLRYKGLVKAVKWVEYWIAVVVRCAVRTPDRVHRRQIRNWNEFERSIVFCRGNVRRRENRLTV